MTVVYAGLAAVAFLVQKIGVVDLPIFTAPDISRPLGWLIFGWLVLALVAYSFLPRLTVGLKNRRLIWLFIVIFAALFAALPALGSIDIYFYAFYPKILLAYGQNPYFSLIKDFPADNFYSPYLNTWMATPMVYGPLWLYFAAVAVAPFLSNLAAAIISLKVLAAAFFIGCLVLIDQILKQLAPARRLVSLVLLGWSPFVLWETVNNGHNDIMMIGFFLLACFLLIKNKYLWIFPALTLSVLIKPVTLIFFPFFGLSLWRTTKDKERREVWWSLGLSAAAVVLVWLPLWRGAETLHALFKVGDYYNSLPLIAPLTYWFYHFPAITGQPDGISFPRFLQLTGLTVGGCFYLWLLLKSKSRTPVDLFKVCFKASLIVLLIVAIYTQPWYWLLPIFILALIPDWPWRYLVGLTLAAFLTYYFSPLQLSLMALAAVIGWQFYKLIYGLFRRA